MAAAYAAVVSLMNIMEQIRDHPRLPTSFDPIQIESLGENLDFFLAFIEGYSVQGTGSKEMEGLEMQIASAAHAAEDVIESHVVGQIRAGFNGTSPSFLIDLQKIIEYMSVIKELLAKFKEERLYKDEQSKDQQPPAVPSRPPISRNTTMVGFDDVLLQLLDRLTAYRQGLEVVPIVGLGGIVPNRDDLLKNLKFPVSLRKLILQDCELHWDDLSTIGCLLPSLEVLKLKRQSVRGTKWNTVEGQFVRLRILEIDSCHLIYWNAHIDHFPRLEKLVLVRLCKLDQIPSVIRDIPTLKEICKVECSISAAISAARILVELEEILVELEEIIDEVNFQVRVRFRKEEELAEFTAKMELQALTSSNLQIDRV